jgi:transposase
MGYRRYAIEFKEQACKLGSDPAVGPGSAAQKLGVPESTLRLWMKDRGLLEARPIAAMAESLDPAVLKQQICELRELLRQSEIDKDILKKAAAFFARSQP